MRGEKTCRFCNKYEHVGNLLPNGYCRFIEKDIADLDSLNCDGYGFKSIIHQGNPTPEALKAYEEWKNSLK